MVLDYEWALKITPVCEVWAEQRVLISVYDKAGNVYIYPFYYFFKISFIDQSIDSLIEKKTVTW